MEILRQGEFLGTPDFYLKNDVLAASITSYHKADTAADVMHFHEYPNFYFILNGGSIERRKTSATELATGSLLYYHAGEVHQNLRMGNNPKSFNMEVDRRFLGQYNLDENTLDRSLLESNTAKLVVLNLCRELLANDDFSEDSVQLLLLNLLACQGNRKQYSDWPTWVTMVKEQLHDRWNETVTLEQLSAGAGVNPITISKHFNKYFDSTLGEYIRKLKITRSLPLIKSTRLSLTEIAYECGFADQSHFTRLFKKYTGFLPLQFRKL